MAGPLGAPRLQPQPLLLYPSSGWQKLLSVVPLPPRIQGTEGVWKSHAPAPFQLEGAGRKRSSGPGDHRKQRPQGLVLQLERDLLSKDLWGAGLLPCCPLP